MVRRSGQRARGRRGDDLGLGAPVSARLGGAKRGAARAPRRVCAPSFTLSIYKRFKLDCYTLQEYDPALASWERDEQSGEERWRFGQSELGVRREAGRVLVEATIDERVPGSRERLKGTVRLDGVARAAAAPGSSAAGDPRHDWTPLMGPAQGRVDVRFGATARYAFEARGYHDRNGADAPLHELGFRHWIWGRIPLSDREIIYYVLWPRGGGEPTCLGLEIAQDGSTTIHKEVTARCSGTRRELAGMSWRERVELFIGGERWGEVRMRSIIDNGPFYLRFFTESRFRGERAVGLGESCEPARVDLARHRPLVKMRVGQAAPSEDSVWRPLFTGPRRGRVKRLVRQMLPGSLR